MVPSRLAIVTTHPIQYHAPWFRALALHPEIDPEVFYCHQATPQEQAQAGFGIEFEWDVSLLDGYTHRFLKNVSSRPGITGFGGLDTPEIKQIIERESFDAVLINGWHYKSAWQAMRACWKTKTPVMVRSDSHLHTKRSAARAIAKWPMYRWFIPKLDACLPVGRWSRDYFLHYGAKPERVFTIPHVVDDTYFSQAAERLRPQRNELRAKWNLDARTTVFLFAGKFVEKKRPMDFLKALDLAVKRGATVAGLMVGDGPLRPSCEEFVRRKKLPVQFTGFLNQSEITKAYVAADALVLPSESETWGLVASEALLSGLPCFLSDQVGCGPDLIINDVTGYIFPMADNAALAELISSFAADEPRRQMMSKRAKQMANSYLPATAAEATLAAVRSVAKIRKRDL